MNVGGEGALRGSGEPLRLVSDEVQTWTVALPEGT